MYGYISSAESTVCFYAPKGSSGPESSVIAAVLFMFLVWYAIERIIWLVTCVLMAITQGVIYLHERLMLIRIASFMQWNNKKEEKENGFPPAQE